MTERELALLTDRDRKFIKKMEAEIEKDRKRAKVHEAKMRDRGKLAGERARKLRTRQAIVVGLSAIKRFEAGCNHATMTILHAKEDARLSDRHLVAGFYVSALVMKELGLDVPPDSAGDSVGGGSGGG